MKTRKPFRFKQFEIVQEGGCMPVTTDACIFGAMADIGNAKNVLDIGTGTGLLSLMLAQRFPEANFTAIDIDEASVNQAHINFENSPWKNRLQAIKADIRDWESEIQFDAIICNPPFFDNQLPSENEDKRRARHTVTLNFEILFEKINSFLNEEGLFWLLTPVLHLNSIKSITEKYNFHIQQFVNIASFKHSKSHLISLHIGKNKTENKFNDFFIYEEQGTYSPEMKLLMNDFYLTQPI